MITVPMLLAAFFGTLTGLTGMRAEQMQPAALTLATFACMLGAAYPDGAWRRALMLGLSVPLAQLISTATGVALPYPAMRLVEACLALVPAFVGTYVGVGLRRWIMASQEQKQPRS
jgi:hypothetical protein